jgi:hypothetical protein
MDDNRKRALDVLMRMSCIFAPPLLLLSMRLLFHSSSVATWKYEVAGGVVVTWSVVVGYRTRVARRNGIWRLYMRAFAVSVSEQAVVLCLAALMLDGGLMLYACLLAGLLYWVMAGAVVARRRILPTRFDLWLVTYGFLAFVFPVIAIVSIWQYHYWW